MSSRTIKPGARAATGPLTAAEIPVTRIMFGSLRTEVLQRIDQSREEAKADNEKLDAKIDAVDAKIDAVKAELHEVKAGMSAMQAQMARIERLMDEQNARNKSLLDGITALLGRQDQVEQRVSQVEDTVRQLAAPQRTPEST